MVEKEYLSIFVWNVLLDINILFIELQQYYIHILLLLNIHPFHAILHKNASSGWVDEMSFSE